MKKEQDYPNAGYRQPCDRYIGPVNKNINGNSTKDTLLTVIISMVILTLIGIILFPSCRKATTDDKILPDVSGIYFDREYELRTDSVTTSYVFVFQEEGGSLKQGLMVLWLRKPGDTAASFHLEGELTPSRWERDVNGRLFAEGSCDLGPPAGVVMFQGVFHEGITLDFHVVSILYPDSGTILRESVNAVPPPLSSNTSGASYLGKWDWQFSGGYLCCGSECKGWGPDSIPSFMASVLIDDETLGNRVNTYYGFYDAPDPTNPGFTWFLPFWGLTIFSPISYTHLVVNDGFLIDCSISDTAWLPETNLHTTTSYIINMGDRCGYLLSLNISRHFECGDHVFCNGDYYPTVRIGNRCWFAKNLNAGIRINGNQAQTNNGIPEKHCYNDNEANCDTYGALYQWDEAMQYSTAEGAQGICPPDWHIPTLAENQELAASVDNNGDALKATGQGTGTNTSGFSALLGGYHDNAGGFLYLHYNTFLWSSTDDGPAVARGFNLHYDNTAIVFGHDSTAYGFSLRCIKNN